jgi:hypothetical protein
MIAELPASGRIYIEPPTPLAPRLRYLLLLVHGNRRSLLAIWSTRIREGTLVR